MASVSLNVYTTVDKNRTVKRTMTATVNSSIRNLQGRPAPMLCLVGAGACYDKEEAGRNQALASIRQHVSHFCWARKKKSLNAWLSLSCFCYFSRSLAPTWQSNANTELRLAPPLCVPTAIPITHWSDCSSLMFNNGRTWLFSQTIFKLVPAINCYAP